MAVCTITGTITKLDESPASDQQVIATVKSTADDMGGQVASTSGIVSESIEAFTDEEGTFSIDLTQGARVLLEIPSINLRKEIVVPAEATKDFLELI